MWRNIFGGFQPVSHSSDAKANPWFPYQYRNDEPPGGRREGKSGHYHQCPPAAAGGILSPNLPWRLKRGSQCGTMHYSIPALRLSVW